MPDRIRPLKACECLSPIVPHPNNRGFDRWYDVLKRNADLAAKTTDEVDVVFYGDSITEHWLGTNFLTPVRQLQDVAATFRHLFTKEGGSDVEGIPLGISGDQVRTTCSLVSISFVSHLPTVE